MMLTLSIGYKMPRKYRNIQHFLLGRTVGTWIIDSYDFEKREFVVRLSPSVTINYKVVKLIGIIESQNKNLYKRTLKMYPEYFV